MSKKEEIILVSEEQATTEAWEWLGKQKITKRSIERAGQTPSVEKLIDGIMSGVFVIDDSGQLRQNLLFPVGVEAKLTVLEYSTRLTTGEVEQQNEKVNEIAGANYLHCFCAAMTSINLSLLVRMDIKDWHYAKAIVLFFML